MPYLRDSRMEELITAVDFDKLNAIVDNKLLQLRDFVNPDVCMFYSKHCCSHHFLSPNSTERLHTELSLHRAYVY